MLLDDVKNDLDITWDDPASDRKLYGIINRGMSYLTGIAGTTLSFETEGFSRALLFDYCRYARSNALDQFSKNYKAELLQLRIGREVEDFALETLS